jgi:Sec-independent protein translocase protein TatA
MKYGAALLVALVVLFILLIVLLFRRTKVLRSDIQDLSKSIIDVKTAQDSFSARLKDDLFDQIKGIAKKAELPTPTAKSETPEATDQEEAGARTAPESHSKSGVALAGSGSQSEPVADKADALPLPSSVAEYLKYLEDIHADIELISLKPFREGIFTENKGGEFILIRGKGNPDSPLSIIPRVKRFSTRDVYYTYYKDCFECSVPSAGEVRIMRPAVVVPGRAKGEWELREKGVLEVK